MQPDELKSLISESIYVKTKILSDDDFILGIIEASRTIISVLKQGGKILICGNGGSAADAQHFAAELVCRFKRERKGLAAISLTCDSSALTAWSNDYDYVSYFSRAVEALANKGDMFIGITTSGNSKNVVAACSSAKQVGCKTLVLAGGGGGDVSMISDRSLIVPSTETARIQESHILIIHLLCELIDREFY